MLFIPLSAGAASAPEQASPKLSAGAGAASSSNYEKAIDLKILGLLATKPANFELDRPPKRAEGLAMLIRLLGKENEVLQGDYKHPFKDVPTWADKYVGYAYQNGIVRGKSSDTYGAHDPMTAKQYVALVLRSIGYKDGVDFEYNQALDKAVEIGLLSRSEANELKNRSVFLRDDLVAVSYNALTVKIKGSSRTLAEKLVDTDKSVFRPAAELLGLHRQTSKGSMVMSFRSVPSDKLWLCHQEYRRPGQIYYKDARKPYLVCRVGHYGLQRRHKKRVPKCL